MSVVRCDISGERKRSNEQRLSDVQEAGSKKAPQIHAINNVSPHTQRENIRFDMLTETATNAG